MYMNIVLVLVEICGQTEGLEKVELIFMQWLSWGAYVICEDSHGMSLLNIRWAQQQKRRRKRTYLLRDYAALSGGGGGGGGGFCIVL